METEVQAKAESEAVDVQAEVKVKVEVEERRRMMYVPVVPMRIPTTHLIQVLSWSRLCYC